MGELASPSRTRRGETETGKMAKKLNAFQTRVLKLAQDEGKQRIDKIFVTEAQYQRLEAMHEAGLIDFRSKSNFVEYTITAAGRAALNDAGNG